MATTFIQCPKCGHRRLPNETATPEQCPACGLYFAKWLARESFVPPSLQQPGTELQDEAPGWRNQILDCLRHVPSEVSRADVWGRALMLVFLSIWGTRIAAMDYRDGEMGGSFMHNILLPIHEAGHLLFLPLGEFMTILGGSLFQVLLPLIVAAALLWRNRDAFGAAVGLWWASVSLIDLAPYVYDAKQPQLIMLGGHTGEDGPHDWIYLLNRFGRVNRSQVYGIWLHHVAVVFMLMSLLAAAAALWRWHKARCEND